VGRRHQRHPRNRRQRLGKQLKAPRSIAGADHYGRRPRRKLILDVLGIGQRSGAIRRVPRTDAHGTGAKGADGAEQQSCSWFRAGFVRTPRRPAFSRFALEEFRRQGIERAAGQVCSTGIGFSHWYLWAIYWSLACRFGGTADPCRLVAHDGDRSVGMVVDEILDVAEEVVAVRQKSSRKGLLGSAVVGEKVTDFIDLSQVIQAAAEPGFRAPADPRPAGESCLPSPRLSREG